jgi:hypothetical protein
MSTKGLSDELTWDHGILQGETLNLFLFIIVLDFAIRALDKDASLSDIKNRQWRLFRPDRKGLRSPALYLTDMDLADDIALRHDLRGDPANTRRSNQGDKGGGGGLFINVATTYSMAIWLILLVQLRWIVFQSTAGLEVSGLLCRVGGLRHQRARLPLRLMPVWKPPPLNGNEVAAVQGDGGTWPLTMRREHRLTSHWFRLIRQIVNCRWPYHGKPMSQSYRYSN